MADIRELREGIQKQDIILDHVSASIADIEKHEALLFNQCMSGAFDKVPEAALRQKMEQLDAYRSDRYALIEQREEIVAERGAMCEEVVNILRRRVGMGDLPDSMDRPLVTMEADDHLVRGGRHPGSKSAVVNHKKPMA